MLTRDDRRALVASGLKDPLLAYRSQRTNARCRNIAFLLSFEEWWALWEPHWAERGMKPDQKCMCRKADQGAYEVGNVRIDTNRANVAEWQERVRRERMERQSLPKVVSVETRQARLERIRTNRYDKVIEKWGLWA